MRGLLVTTGTSSNWRDFLMNQGKEPTSLMMDGVHSGVYAQLKETDGCFQGVEVY